MFINVIRSRRKTLSMTVGKDGSVQVRAPYGVPLSEIQQFVDSHQEWVDKQQMKMQEIAEEQSRIPRLTRDELEDLAQAALRDLPERARRFAPLVGVRYGRITIRNQKSKWGSCSSKGNLNFNCLLMLAPEYVRDYVVVHELCHLKQMNHSKAFWAEVERALPDYRKGKDWLKQNGPALMARNPGA